MEPEAPFRGQVFTVTAITLAIKQMMEGVFRGVFVEGEVGQLREAASGHLYFNLKDRDALLAAVMFKWDARKNGLDLQEGMQVRVFGDLSCYAKQGKYQIVVKNVEALHKGNLFLEFEKLKRKLEAEGLFAPEHKKSIPSFPRRIGVVTSPTGAAIRDILSVLRRRSPNLEGYIKVWEWMGSAPTPLSMGETYTALQQGTVEGQENSILDSQSYSFQEVCPYWILTNHVYSANTIIMDKTYFESLPEDIQSALEEAAVYAGEQVSQEVLEREETAKEELSAEGVTFVEVDNAAFAEHFDGYAEANFPDLADWCNQIRALAPNA